MLAARGTTGPPPGAANGCQICHPSKSGDRDGSERVEIQESRVAIVHVRVGYEGLAKGGEEQERSREEKLGACGDTSADDIQ